MKLFSIIPPISVAILFAGCVSQSKYNSAIQAMESYRSDSTAWATQVTTLRNSIQVLEEKNAACQHQIDSLLRVRQENRRTHAVLLSSEEQDTDLEQLTSQLQDFAKGSKIISAIQKKDHKIQLEIKSGTGNKAGVLSDTDKESLYKIVSMIKSFDDLEVIAVDQWTDLNMSGRANIGDSAWVGSAGQGKPGRDKKDEDREDGYRDSAATASIGSQPYPGSGAVAMNTKKKKNNSDVADDLHNAADAIISEFSRHGLSIRDLTNQNNSKGRVKSGNKNKTVRLIIQQRTGKEG